jgi:hypothetical protein
LPRSSRSNAASPISPLYRGPRADDLPAPRFRGGPASTSTPGRPAPRVCPTRHSDTPGDSSTDFDSAADCGSARHRA